MKVFSAAHSEEDADVMIKVVCFLVERYSLDDGCKMIDDMKLVFEAALKRAKRN